MFRWTKRIDSMHGNSGAECKTQIIWSIPELWQIPFVSSRNYLKQSVTSGWDTLGDPISGTEIQVRRRVPRQNGSDVQAEHGSQTKVINAPEHKEKNRLLQKKLLIHLLLWSSSWCLYSLVSCAVDWLIQSRWAEGLMSVPSVYSIGAMCSLGKKRSWTGKQWDDKDFLANAVGLYLKLGFLEQSFLNFGGCGSAGRDGRPLTRRSAIFWSPLPQSACWSVLGQDT